MNAIAHTTQIRHWITGALIYEGPGTLREVLEAAVASGANLYGASLSRANLSGASLSGASLSGASLSGASLSRASLSGANLDRANLSGANLSGANLYGANLDRANLSGASLSGANLSGANLSGASLDDSTTLPGGVTWLEYRTVVLPWFLTAGGQTLESFRSVGALACHDWTNCLTAHAYSVHSLEEVPAMYRPWAALTIQLFDARLLGAILEELIPGGEVAS